MSSKVVTAPSRLTSELARCTIGVDAICESDQSDGPTEGLRHPQAKATKGQSHFVGIPRLSAEAVSVYAAGQEVTGSKLVRTAGSVRRPELRRPLRDRVLLRCRPIVVGLVAGGTVAAGAATLPEALAIGFGAALVSVLGWEGLHRALRTRTVADRAIRSQVANNPSLAYAIPFPGITGIVVAVDRGLSGADVALVIAGAGALTWLMWEAVDWVAARSPRVYGWVTRWESRAIRVRSAQLNAAELRWRERGW